MKIAIMQPYFFPYIGYFQLIHAVNEFIVYDNIEYTKKGWINRNRILTQGKDEFITLPLKKDSDFLMVRERYLADTWVTDQAKMLNRLRESYRKAPYFARIFPLIESILAYEGKNLFDFIFNSLEAVTSYLEIRTPLLVSSSLDIDPTLRSQQKVIAICKARLADTYINPIGGLDLYNKEDFKASGIGLKFLKSDSGAYSQFEKDAFIPWLSILDVLMFNGKEKTITDFLNQYTFI